MMRQRGCRGVARVSQNLSPANIFTVFRTFLQGTLELFPPEDSLTGGTKASHAAGRFVQVIYPSRNRQDYPLDY